MEVLIGSKYCCGNEFLRNDQNSRYQCTDATFLWKRKSQKFPVITGDANSARYIGIQNYRYQLNGAPLFWTINHNNFLVITGDVISAIYIDIYMSEIIILCVWKNYTQQRLSNLTAKFSDSLLQKYIYFEIPRIILLHLIYSL